MLIDEKGKRYLAKLEGEMTEVSGLGTIRTELLKNSLRTGVFSLGGRNIKVRTASVDDMISAITRKAQMLTSKDIAMIIHHCDIKSGSVVVEGGVGSGALTISLLSRVGKEGKVITYEIRDDFASIAKHNVALASLTDCWTLKIGDIRNRIDEEGVDSIVVDIPVPWECVPSAEKALRIGGFFSAFVPNVNQMEKTVQELRNYKFEDVRAIETLQREMIVHEGGVRPSFDMLGHTGYLIFARRSP